MGRYKKYEYLPWWLNSLDDNTLTPTQKEVLDLDYYCKRHGTKLSHQRAADMLDRSRHCVYVSRRRLGELCLRTTESSKGSFLVGHPIEYQNEATWLSVLRSADVDPQRFKKKRKSSSKKKITKESSSSSKVSVAPAETAEARDFHSQAPRGLSEASAPEAAEARDLHSQSPRGLTNRCSGGGDESPPTQEQKDGWLWNVYRMDFLYKLLDEGYDQDRAERLARVRADRRLSRTKAERESK